MLEWLNKEIANDAAPVMVPGADSTGSSDASSFVERLGWVLGFVGEMFSGNGRDSERSEEFDYIGEQWATHGHSGPFGQWTED
ncbi:MAG: hypothetical protein JF606_26965 [Burkholderiales bacterium]|nr:hypothetical protein [Burkholderiales bacterium]